jgi:uncharacterized protein (DUF488 family)
MTTVYTIGYEGASVPDCIAALKAAGVTLLIDVREVASSRRAGFSKNILAASLAEAGIAYRHLRALGTPKAGRVANHSGDLATFERIYREHLAGEEAQAALALALELAREQPSCLLCYERDPRRCHRSIIAEAMAGRETVEIRHLTPDPVT